MKTRKSLAKRIKITSTGKILRRHQLGAGHLKRKKSKGALARAKKLTTFFRGDEKRLKRMLGV